LERVLDGSKHPAAEKALKASCAAKIANLEAEQIDFKQQVKAVLDYRLTVAYSENEKSISRLQAKHIQEMKVFQIDTEARIKAHYEGLFRMERVAAKNREEKFKADHALAMDFMKAIQEPHTRKIHADSEVNLSSVKANLHMDVERLIEAEREKQEKEIQIKSVEVQLKRLLLDDREKNLNQREMELRDYAERVERRVNTHQASIGHEEIILDKREKNLIRRELELNASRNLLDQRAAAVDAAVNRSLVSLVERGKKLDQRETEVQERAEELWRREVVGRADLRAWVKRTEKLFDEKMELEEQLKKANEENMRSQSREVYAVASGKRKRWFE